MPIHRDVRNHRAFLFFSFQLGQIIFIDFLKKILHVKVLIVNIINQHLITNSNFFWGNLSL